MLFHDRNLTGKTVSGFHAPIASSSRHEKTAGAPKSFIHWLLSHGDQKEMGLKGIYFTTESGAKRRDKTNTFDNIIEWEKSEPESVKSLKQDESIDVEEATTELLTNPAFLRYYYEIGKILSRSKNTEALKKYDELLGIDEYQRKEFLTGTLK